MSRTAVFYDPLYLEHDSGLGHPERAERLERAMELMESTRLVDKVRVLSPRDATVEEIELVHPRAYIDSVKRVADSGGGWLDPDTHVGTRSYEAALRSAGAALDGLERIFSGEIDNAFCLARPPGHHATATRGMGFCLFNNNAVAARFAMERFGISRVFILDWDAHHGNGIQDIFYRDDRVLYVSLHQYPHYPGTGSYREMGEGKGEGYTVNFPLPARTGEEVYLQAFDRVIVPLALRYQPELVLVSAGYDGHFSDPLCSMLLKSTSYAEMAERLKRLAGEVCGGRMLVCLEGGYNLTAVARSIVNTVAVLAGDELRVEDEEVTGRGLPASERGLEVVEAVLGAVRPYWKI
ncbi:histone deacetylase [Candidatus Solincola tengchongensis]|uniref:histone deacetylase family protein n=1 Tax=Candidatus Solincola tengchongensis TaxID=2900693 RepID=UPI00257C9F6C|nr:histone deacetylase [Candidatus Solincola tengchongensis]